MRALGIVFVILAVLIGFAGFGLSAAANPAAGYLLLASAAGLFWIGIACILAGNVVNAIRQGTRETVAAIKAQGNGVAGGVNG